MNLTDAGTLIRDARRQAGLTQAAVRDMSADEYRQVMTRWMDITYGPPETLSSLTSLSPLQGLQT